MIENKCFQSLLAKNIMRLRKYFYLCSQDEVVVPEVPDPEDETELLVALGHHGVVAEDDGLLAELGPGQLGEHQAHHEGLDQAAQH